MATQKLSTSGNFLTRIEENANNGWVYPEAIVKKAENLGKQGNGIKYYYFNGRRFRFLCLIPNWASPRGWKYKKYFQALGAINLPTYTLQSFISRRIEFFDTKRKPRKKIEARINELFCNL